MGAGNAAKGVLDLRLLDVEAFGIAVVGAQAAQSVSQIAESLPCALLLKRVHLVRLSLRSNVALLFLFSAPVGWRGSERRA